MSKHLVLGDIDQGEAGDNVTDGTDEEEDLDPALESRFNALYDASVQKSLGKSGLVKQYSMFIRSRIAEGHSQAEAKTEAKELLMNFSEVLKGLKSAT